MLPSLLHEHLRNETSRESALLCLRDLLLERKKTDPSAYKTSALMLFSSSTTMMILIREIIVFTTMMTKGCLTKSAYHRCIYVLTIFEMNLVLRQCIATNPETRLRFVSALILDQLICIIMCNTSFDGFEDVRALALSVICTLCEDERPYMIKWVIDKKLADALKILLEIGNESIILTTLRLIVVLLQRGPLLYYICSGHNNCHLLESITKTWEDLIHRISSGMEYSEKLLFSMLKCFVPLRIHPEGRRVVLEKVRSHFESLIVVTKACPTLNNSVKHLQKIYDISGG